LIACLFVAAALSNTATEVVARVAERSRFSQLLVSAALIDDILAVYILGILSAAAIREILDLSVFFWATLGVVVFFFLVGYLSHKLMVERDIMRKLWRFERRGVPLTFALSLALALAVIAQRVGLHAIIGAYMAGLFIGRLRERPDALLLSRIRLNAMLEDVTTSLQSILTPMFFVYVGLTFAPQWGEIKFVMLLVLLIAAFAGKIIGCGLGAAAVGYKRKDSLAIGTAMCSRGSLEVAVLLFGLEAGVVPPDLFSMMVMVTLSTTLLTPLFFRRT
jgi:Kef-type K+ transport system membrane component KefB